MVHAGGVHGGGVHGGGVMLTLATPHSRRCWQLFLRLSPYSRSSPFSGTALSQAQPSLRHSPLQPAGRSRSALSAGLGVPVPPKTNRNASSPAVFRAKNLAPAPRREGVRAVDRNASRPSAGPRAGRIARPTDKYPLEGGPGLAPISHYSPNGWIWDWPSVPKIRTIESAVSVTRTRACKQPL